VHKFTELKFEGALSSILT